MLRVRDITYKPPAVARQLFTLTDQTVDPCCTNQENEMVSLKTKLSNIMDRMTIVEHLMVERDKEIIDLKNKIGRLSLTPGPKGVKGNRGPTGSKGDQGSTGTAGTTGQRGSKGDQGPRGSNGTPGPKGVMGDRGFSGEKGSKGSRGSTGSTGSKGSKGDEATARPTGYFCSYRDSFSAPNSVITYNRLLHSSQSGLQGDSPDIDINTGKFVSGFGGTYRVDFSLQTAPGPREDMVIYLFKNNVKIPQTQFYSSRSSSGSGYDKNTGGRSVLLHLDKGDELHLGTTDMEDTANRIIFCVSLEGPTGLELRGGTSKSGNVYITNTDGYHGPVCDYITTDFGFDNFARVVCR